MPATRRSCGSCAANKAKQRCDRTRFSCRTCAQRPDSNHQLCQVETIRFYGTDFMFKHAPGGGDDELMEQFPKKGRLSTSSAYPQQPYYHVETPWPDNSRTPWAPFYYASLLRARKESPYAYLAPIDCNLPTKNLPMEELRKSLTMAAFQQDELVLTCRRVCHLYVRPNLC